MSLNIGAWQREFYAQPCVWITFYRDSDGTEEMAHVYESEEAALLERAFAVARGHRGRRLPMIRKLCIHSLKLATERWVSAPAAAASGASAPEAGVAETREEDRP